MKSEICLSSGGMTSYTLFELNCGFHPGLFYQTKKTSKMRLPLTTLREATTTILTSFVRTGNAASFNLIGAISVSTFLPCHLIQQSRSKSKGPIVCVDRPRLDVLCGQASLQIEPLPRSRWYMAPGL